MEIESENILAIPNIKIIPIDKLAPYPALTTANVVTIPSTLFKIFSCLNFFFELIYYLPTKNCTFQEFTSTFMFFFMIQ
jgi:hypothetical protein